MYVQNISNSQIPNQSFQGKAFITGFVNPRVRTELIKAINNVNISEKPYNIYVKNTKNDEFLSITAQKNAYETKKVYTVFVHQMFQKAEVINEAMQEAVNNYEKLFMKK